MPTLYSNTTAKGASVRDDLTKQGLRYRGCCCSDKSLAQQIVRLFLARKQTGGAEHLWSGKASKLKQVLRMARTTRMLYLWQFSKNQWETSPTCSLESICHGVKTRHVRLVTSFPCRSSKSNGINFFVFCLSITAVLGQTLRKARVATKWRPNLKQRHNYALPAYLHYLISTQAGSSLGSTSHARNEKRKLQRKLLITATASKGCHVGRWATCMK